MVVPWSGQVGDGGALDGLQREEEGKNKKKVDFSFLSSFSLQFATRKEVVTSWLSRT